MDVDESLIQKTTRNVGWDFATKLVTKIGGLFFTIILARMLLPELFGQYNLVLSIVIIATMLTDLGIGNTATRYLSFIFGKNEEKKARTYFIYFLKIKGLLLFLAILFLLLSSKFLAYNLFEKPAIFIPLIASTFYLLALSFRNLLNIIFISRKELHKLFILETIFEILKVIAVVLVISFFSKSSVVSGIFLSLALATFIAILFCIPFLKNQTSLFFGEKGGIEKKRVWRYLESMSLVSISLVLFGSVDTLMLGRFVEVSFIGYYRAALSLVITVSAFFGFGNVLLPVFTQIHRQKIERAFEKGLKYLSIFVIPVATGVVIIAKYFILAIYGKEYLPATSCLYILSPIILIFPFVALYSSIFQAKEKTKFLVNAVLISLTLNIILNYILIKSLISISQGYAIVGAGAATLISRAFYLVFLAIKSKKLFKTKIPLQTILKSALSTLVMAIFLIWFNFYFNINIYLGILEILLGAGIYFVCMFLIKGIIIEDLNLLKIFMKKK